LKIAVFCYGCFFLVCFVSLSIDISRFFFSRLLYSLCLYICSVDISRFFLSSALLLALSTSLAYFWFLYSLCNYSNYLFVSLSFSLSMSPGFEYLNPACCRNYVLQRIQFQFQYCLEAR